MKKVIPFAIGAVLASLALIAIAYSKKTGLYWSKVTGEFIYTERGKYYVVYYDVREDGSIIRESFPKLDKITKQKYNELKAKIQNEI